MNWCWHIYSSTSGKSHENKADFTSWFEVFGASIESFSKITWINSISAFFEFNFKFELRSEINWIEQTCLRARSRRNQCDKSNFMSHCDVAVKNDQCQQSLMILAHKSLGAIFSIRWVECVFEVSSCVAFELEMKVS